eukprot:m.15461 g.15461  ORF g.15461 m.15461 type:complete len:500 (+) comp7854_c0_seq2:1999-3498(+)
MKSSSGTRSETDRQFDVQAAAHYLAPWHKLRVISDEEPCSTRPHWFYPDLEECSELCGDKLQRLLSSHSYAVIAHFDKLNQCIVLDVTKLDTQHARDVPLFVNDYPVQLSLANPEFPKVDSLAAMAEIPPDVAQVMLHELRLLKDAFLARHPDVWALSGSYRRRGGAIDFSEVCVTAFVRSKQRNLPTVCCVERKLGSFAVDVEEMPSSKEANILRVIEEDMFYDEESRAAFNQGRDMATLRVGDTIYIGPENARWASCGAARRKGTLGCFLRPKAPGRSNERFALTAGHVVKNLGQNVQGYPMQQTIGVVHVRMDETETRHTMQSSRDYAAIKIDLDAGFTCDSSGIGTNVDWQHMDHKVIALSGEISTFLGNDPETSSASEVAWSLRDSALSLKQLLPEYAVFKFGQTTRLTVGCIANVPLFLREDRVRIKIRPWQGWTKFADSGDSGSVIFDRAGAIVGLLTQSWRAHGFCICIPITEVLGELEMELVPRDDPEGI